MGAIATAFAALTALVVIPYQASVADRIQRDQTAREIYREFLNLTVQKPELATADYCTLKEPDQIAAYSAYVDYLLYTAEQMIATSPEWRGPMSGYMGAHTDYLCSAAVQTEPAAQEIMSEIGLLCPTAPSCG